MDVKARIIDVLEGAIETLETDGWTQHNYVDESGCKCALGALGFSQAKYMDTLVFGTTEMTPKITAGLLAGFNQVLTNREDTGHVRYYDSTVVGSWADVAYWNDSVATDKDQVLDVFRDVLELTRRS